MNILKTLHPESKEVTLDGEVWDLPYKVWDLIELEKVIIVHFLSKEFRENCPKDIYIGCNIWCYNKNDKSIKWIIEEPPLAYINGKLWNRGLSPANPTINRDECYMDIGAQNEYYKSRADNELALIKVKPLKPILYSTTTGARGFLVNEDTGKVTLIRTGLR